MIFTLNSPTDRAVKTIWLETDDFVDLCIGEISRERGVWSFHYSPMASHLKVHALAALNAFGSEQIVLINIKEKILA